MGVVGGGDRGAEWRGGRRGVGGGRDGGDGEESHRGPAGVDFWISEGLQIVRGTKDGVATAMEGDAAGSA